MRLVKRLRSKDNIKNQIVRCRVCDPGRDRGKKSFGGHQRLVYWLKVDLSFTGIKVKNTLKSPYWNLIIDPLLRKLGELGVYEQGFADRVLLVFAKPSTLSVEDFNRALVELLF
ncbi:hypothetical protein EVAR_49205_1 [Eumeta japonica]|uniref:Uncharacterized protein n=1 Tax=Eumeta variegata TaxID=151549 RepID=A0A4C1XPI5_EUMVA|nr:hypothetical protein EVAR_49205_1 [Eumeta japonica]